MSDMISDVSWSVLFLSRQKTANDLRIGDGCSGVCSPALTPGPAVPTQPAAPGTPVAGQAGTLASPPIPVSSPAPEYPRASLRRRESGNVLLRVHVGPDGAPRSIDLISEIGRASGRERVCQSV